MFIRSAYQWLFPVTTTQAPSTATTNTNQSSTSTQSTEGTDEAEIRDLLNEMTLKVANAEEKTASFATPISQGNDAELPLSGGDELTALSQEQKNIQIITRAFETLLSNIRNKEAPATPEEIKHASDTAIKDKTALPVAHYPLLSNAAKKIETEITACAPFLSEKYRDLWKESQKKTTDHAKQKEFCNDAIQLGSNLNAFVNRIIKIIEQEKVKNENLRGTLVNLLEFGIAETVHIASLKAILSFISEIIKSQYSNTGNDNALLNTKIEVAGDLSKLNGFLSAIIAGFQGFYSIANGQFTKMHVKQPLTISIPRSDLEIPTTPATPGTPGKKNFYAATSPRFLRSLPPLSDTSSTKETTKRGERLYYLHV